MDQHLPRPGHENPYLLVKEFTLDTLKKKTGITTNKVRVIFSSNMGTYLNITCTVPKDFDRNTLQRIKPFMMHDGRYATVEISAEWREALQITKCCLKQWENCKCSRSGSSSTSLSGEANHRHKRQKADALSTEFHKFNSED